MKTIPEGYRSSPTYALEDLRSIAIYLACFLAVVFFDPYLFFPKDAFLPANPFVTPAHIKPEWYFLANYQTLKIFPNELIGLSLQGAAMTFLALLPFIDRGGGTASPETAAVHGLRHRRASALDRPLASGGTTHETPENCHETHRTAVCPDHHGTDCLPAAAESECRSAGRERLHPVSLRVARKRTVNRSNSGGEAFMPKTASPATPATAATRRMRANAMSPARGFLGVPKDTAIPAFCGRCHVGVMKDYLASAHGRALGKGGPTCVTCHGNHQVLKASLDLINERSCSRCHSFERARIIRDAMQGNEVMIVALDARISAYKKVGTDTEKLEKELFATRNRFHSLFHNVNVEAVKRESTLIQAELKKIQDVLGQLDGAGQKRKLAGAIAVAVMLLAALLIHLLRKTFD